jgi:hypothetical protein
MRNNKYVALFMAVLAVAVVLYQFVLRPGPQSAARPASARPLRPVVVAPTAADAADESPQGEPAPAQRALVDMNSELLLHRVSDALPDGGPDAELAPEFGAPIFVHGNAPDGVGDGRGGEAAPELQLQGTVLDGRRRLAIISHQIVAVGDFVAGAQVLAIRPREVELLQGGRNIRLVTDPANLKIEWLGDPREK